MTRTRCTLAVIALILVASVLPAQGFDSVFGAETEEEAVGAVSVGGSLGMQLDYYLDAESGSEVVASPAAELLVTAAGATAEAVLSLSLDPPATNWLEAPMANLVDELYVTSFFPGGHLTSGLMKIEWGKGDGVHAIDPLNPMDQSTGPSTNYLSSKQAEAMLALNLYLGGNGVAEIVYKPFFHPTTAALQGRWAVIDPSTIPGFATIEPVKVGTLAYSQGAARLTGSLGPLDLGGLYYNGFMPEPGYRFTTTFTGTDPLDPTHYTIFSELVYTRAQLLGAEAGTAIGPVTVRGEVGYWVSEDTDGTIPELYNSRLVYLGGADIMIPRTSIFVSAQVVGSFTNDAEGLVETDVDRLLLYDDSATSTSIIASIEMPFARETMNARVSGIYSVEANGYIVMPEFRWTIADGADLLIAGMVIGGEELSGGNSPYFAWRDNDRVSISLEYQF